MSLSFEESFQRFKTFASKTFVDSSAEDYLKKLEEEVEELQQEPSMEELADCMLVLVGLSQYLDGDLSEEVAKKVIKNENRKWKRLENGTYKHY